MSRELELAMQRAERARQLLGDPMIVEALQAMRETAYKNIESSSWRSRGEREELYRMLRTIAAFEKQFHKIITDGKAAKSKLEEVTQKIKSITNWR